MGSFDPSANFCLHVLGLRKLSCRACLLFFFFFFLNIWKFSWSLLSYLDYSFDLPSYISDSTKRYTLLLSICLEAREERFGSYSAWAEMTYCDVCLGWQGEGWNGVEFISAIEVQGSYSEKLLDGLMPL